MKKSENDLVLFSTRVDRATRRAIRQRALDTDKPVQELVGEVLRKAFKPVQATEPAQTS